MENPAVNPMGWNARENRGPAGEGREACDSFFAIFSKVSDKRSKRINPASSPAPFPQSWLMNCPTPGSTDEAPIQNVNGDSGYASGQNYIRLRSEHPHIKAYVPTADYAHPGNGPKPLFDKSNFHFDSIHETCHCPLGQLMYVKSKEMRRGVRNIKFKGMECPSCPAKFLCTQSPQRQVRMTAADGLVADMNARMDTEAGKRAMRERRSTVELVFAHLKEQIGFRRFSLGGRDKVQGEFALVCSV